MASEARATWWHGGGTDASGAGIGGDGASGAGAGGGATRDVGRTGDEGATVATRRTQASCREEKRTNTRIATARDANTRPFGAAQFRQRENETGRRSTVGRALLALVALAGLALGAQPAWGQASCPAPNLAGVTEVWSATLTVGTSKFIGTETVFAYGYVRGALVANNAGSLSDTNFDIGSNRYTIRRFAEAEGGDGTLAFGLSADLTPAQRARLRLHVCGETYDFSDATLAGSLYGWPDANLDWSSVTTRAVALSIRPNAPRFGRARESCFFTEHSAPGTEVCSAQEVRATDADGDTLTYTLGGRERAGFAIDSATGAITLGSASSDYETNRSRCRYGLRSSLDACYELTVTATDPGGSRATMAIFARVLDSYERALNPVNVASRNLSALSTRPEGAGWFRAHWLHGSAAHTVQFQIGYRTRDREAAAGRPARPGQVFWEDPVSPRARTGTGTGTTPTLGSHSGSLFPCSTFTYTFGGRTFNPLTRDDVRQISTDPESRPFHPNDDRSDRALTLRIRARAGSGYWSDAIDFRGCGIDVGPTSNEDQHSAQGMSGDFTNPAEPHDGTAFDARLELSVEPAAGFSYKVFQGDPSTGRESVLQVTNGTVERVQRDGANQNRRWVVTIVPSGDEAVTITLPATTDCDALNAICSADGAMLKEAVTKTVPGPDNDEEEETEEATQPAALTVAYTAPPPPEHDGSTPFTFAFSFNETLHADYSYKTMRDRSLTVMQGGTKLTPHVRRMMKGSNRRWEATVTPAGNAAISIALGPTGSCSETGAMCTEGGTALSNALPAKTVQGPVGVSVADASVQEAAGATLDFAVTLSRAASAAVTVDYATSDGTATAGSDYTETSGTLTFAAGETSKTVPVPVLDDAHDEGEETMTLTLSNASGAHIRDGEATGTIENSDPIPQAWLARFGRTVADHVTEAIGTRLAGPGGGSQVTVGGQRLSLAGGGTGVAADAGGAREDGEAAGGLAALAERLAGGGEADAWDRWERGAAGADGSSRTVSGRELLLGSSFLLGLGGDGDAAGGAATRWTAWGRAAQSRFDGEADGLGLDGDVTTFTLGADAAWSRWLAGVAVALSEGEGGFRDHETTDHASRGSGTLESSLTSVHPYARLEVSERLTVWGTLGYGSGALTLEVDGSGRWETDTSMRMAAVGARGVMVAATGAEPLELAARTDARVVRMTSDAADGAGGKLAAAESGTSRVRVMLEGSRAFALEGGGTVVPSLEVGLRQDGGDAETGTGVELGGGLSYTDPASGLTVDARVRGLIAHEEAHYSEWGASGSVRIEPGPSGRGLSLTLTPAWGATSGGAERLWSLRDARGLAANEAFDPAGRLDAEAGYGLGAFGGSGVMTPYAGLALSGAGERAWRTGVRWTLGPDVAFGLEGSRTEPANDEAPAHGLMVRASLRW